MLKKVFVGVVAVAALSGCVNTSTLSGDTISAKDAKQVQTVTYGTVLNARPVTIQAGEDGNVIGAIGGAVLGAVISGAFVLAPQATFRAKLLSSGLIVLIAATLLAMTLSQFSSLQDEDLNYERQFIYQEMAKELNQR